MPEYRYTGVNITGKPIQGIVFSPDEKAIREKLKVLSKTKGLRIDSIDRKRTYLYKAQRGTEDAIYGEQKAFTKEELHSALTKMGFKVFYVRRKLLDFKRKIPSKDLILFMRISADLLREKFPYDEILTLLSHDASNRTLRETIREVQKDLKAGSEGHQVYGKHEDVLGRFPAHMMAIASTSGNMAQIYESTAKFLERDGEFKSNLRTVLLMPLMVTIAMIGAVIFYVLYIFPKMTGLLMKYDVDIPPLTKATIDFSDFLQDYHLLLFAVIVIPVLIFIQWISTASGRYKFDKWLIQIPVLGPMLHRISIEIFCRVLNALYSSSGENITAIRISAESCRNRFIEKQIASIVIPQMLKEGRSFVECLNRANCFTLTAVRRLRSGEEAGTLSETALQLANYYEKETKNSMGRLVDIINLTVSILITVLIIGLTIVSTEIGFVNPPSPLNR